ncbi:MAG TPA: polymer-forming cytoskeletal protein [Pyrinomonadaceae bacterium]|nr:polymer-forming cytoskeletal protein [Pyrinomonadaceae bacterium]
MLEVNRKPDETNNTGTAPAKSRTFTQHAATSIVEIANGRKGSVLAQSLHGSRAAHTEAKHFQAKIPVITGEAHYRGLIAVDGFLSGQLGANSGCFSVKQKPNAIFGSEPEMDGELNFKDMVRVNGHIAGSVSSPKGTLIVDVGARVDANIDVAVALISGTVNGDIIARDRVEIGPVARINGNIWTKSITIKGGAIFEGVCRMIEEIEDQPF